MTNINDMDGLPMNDSQLQTLLQRGPAVVQSSVRPEVPPPPKVPKLSEEEQFPKDEAPTNVFVGEGTEVAPNPLDNVISNMKKNMGLPSEREKNMLFSKYGVGNLTVVPFPNQNEQFKAFVVKSATRAEWRAAENYAMKMVESKPNRTFEDLFQERIVTQCVVWPDSVSPLSMDTSKAGFVHTVFGIIQKISWFFDSETLINLSFPLQ